MRCIVVLLVCIATLGYGQTMIGQTKTYIINQFAGWRIEKNTDNLLIMSNGEIDQFFGFATQNNLCDVWGTELLTADAEEISAKYKEGALYTLDSFAPLLINCKGGKDIARVPCVRTMRENMEYTLFSTDMCGNKQSGKRLFQMRKVF